MKKTAISLVILLLIMGESLVFAEKDEHSTYYFVQAGYYKNKTILEKDFKTMAQHGFPVYKVASNGGYRIYVGNYSSREEAEEVAKRIKEIGFETLVRTKKISKKEPKKVDPIQNHQKKDPPFDQGTPKEDLKSSEELEFTLKEPISDDNNTVLSSDEKPKNQVNFSRSTNTPETELFPYEESKNQYSPKSKIYIMFFVMVIVIVVTGGVATVKRNHR